MGSIYAHWTTRGFMALAVMAVETLLKERWSLLLGRPTTPHVLFALFASKSYMKAGPFQALC